MMNIGILKSLLNSLSYDDDVEIVMRRDGKLVPFEFDLSFGYKDDKDKFSNDPDDEFVIVAEGI
jgi:hypothetical protein